MHDQGEGADYRPTGKKQRNKKQNLHTKSGAIPRLFLAPTGASGLHVTLRQPATGVDQLDDIDELLERHDRGRNPGDDPRQEAVNLVRTGQLKSTGTPWASEETRRGRMGRVAGLRGGWLTSDGLQERGR